MYVLRTYACAMTICLVEVCSACASSKPVSARPIGIVVGRPACRGTTNTQWWDDEEEKEVVVVLVGPPRPTRIPTWCRLVQAGGPTAFDELQFALFYFLGKIIFTIVVNCFLIV